MTTPQLTVGLNSYVTAAEAATYLSGSAAGYGWEDRETDEQVRALISAARLLERQRWTGEPAGLTIVTAAAVSAGGTGYVVGDVLAVASGTGTVAAALEVTAVSTGAITAAVLLDAGLYSVAPSSPDSVSGGSGSGAAFALTTGSQVMAFPRSGLVDLDGVALAEDEVPQVVRDAQSELASAIAAKTSLERTGSTGNERKRLKAGSVEIEYFRPTGGVRFPAHVQELIGYLLEGSTLQAVRTGGSGAQSYFDDDQAGGLTQGYA